MIAWIIVGVFYLIIAGIVAAFWDLTHMKNEKWKDDLDGAFFVIFWIICVPAYFLFSIGYVIVKRIGR